MSIWPLLPASLFAFLAFDAWRLGRSSKASYDQAYIHEAKLRGEKLDGLSHQERQRRQTWSARHGIGRPQGIVWLWGVLAVGCLVAAAAGVPA